MSKELTIEIMKMFGYDTSPQSVIAFIALANLTPAQKEIVRRTFANMDIPEDLLFKTKEEFAEFFEANEGNFEIDLRPMLLYLKTAADEIDRGKTIVGFENLLRVIPVEFLNVDPLLWLINNTFDRVFWEPRCTSQKNVDEFSRRFPDYAKASNLPQFGSAPVSYEDAKRAYDNAIAPMEKILSLRYLIAMKSDGHMGKEYFDTNLSPLPIGEQLENLEKDYKFLDMQENAEAGMTDEEEKQALQMHGQTVVCIKDIIMDHDEIKEFPKGTVMCSAGNIGKLEYDGSEIGFTVETDYGGYIYENLKDLHEFWELD